MFATRPFRALNAAGIAARSLGKPTSAFPGRVATDADLMIAVDRQQTRLALPLNATDTSMTVVDPSTIGANNLLTIDTEIVRTTAAPTGNVVPISRGFDGTTPAVHLASAVVSGFVDAWHHNTLAAEVEAIEAALGPNLSRVPGSGFATASQYDFAPLSPGGALTIGVNVITLAPVPEGVNGADKHHWLWIDQGTGTPEACEIIGGTAVSGAASGTVIVNCASAHSGAWRIASATAGIEEALNISRYVAVTQQVTVIHAPIWIDSAHELYGAPIWGSEIKQASANTDCVWIGDNGTEKKVTAVLSGLTFSTTSAAWASGWAINCRNVGRCEIRDCFIYGADLIWGGINLHRAIQVNLWNNYISRTRSHAIFISGQDAANQSITCNLMHCETADIGGNPYRIGDWTQGLEFRDCILNGCIQAGIYFGSTLPPGSGGGAQSNYFISGCDIEGAGIYAQNVANMQIVNCWISCTPTVNSLKLTSSCDTVLFASNLITGGHGPGVPLIDTDGDNVHITGNHINGGGTPEIPVLIAVGPNANSTNITQNMCMIFGVGVQINATADATTVSGNSFIFFNTAISGKGTNRYVTGNKGIDDIQASGMAAAATISPVNPVQIIVGGAQINTITVPDAFSGKLTLLPAGAFTWSATGNIWLAGTAVIGKALELTWDTVDNKWWPSYTS